MAKMIINEEFFEEISEFIGLIKLELMRKENQHLNDLKERAETLTNVISYIFTKRHLNKQIDLAIIGYNQSLVNQLIKLKAQAEENLTEREKKLL